MNTSKLRTFLLGSVAIAGFNLFTSCDSCDRKEEHNTDDKQSIEGEAAVYDDTLSNDHADGIGTSSSNRSGSNVSGTSGRGSNASGPAAGRSATGTSPSSGTKSSESNSTGYGDSNSSIENSSSSATKDGTPVRSSGASGSGQGTGTGSTGNNSKVNKPEDQKN